MIAVVLTIVALIAGMKVGGSGIDLFGLYGLAIIFNQVGMLWACGVAMRLRTVQAAPLMQTPVFLVLFLAPVYVPLHLLKGWIHHVARLNPLTFLLEAGRGFIEGRPTEVAAAFAIAAALFALFAVWARTGLVARGARGLAAGRTSRPAPCAGGAASPGRRPSRCRPPCCPRPCRGRRRPRRDDDADVVGQAAVPVEHGDVARRRRAPVGSRRPVARSHASSVGT